MGVLRNYTVLLGSVLLLSLGCSSDNGDDGSFEEAFEEVSEKQYDLSITITPAGSGTVIPNSGSFSEGEEITITAVPHQGYYFSEWSGAIKSGAKSYRIVMNSDMTITAHFKDYPNNWRDEFANASEVIE